MQDTTAYWSLKTGHAPKTSLKDHGLIGYRVLSNVEQTELFICIESNDGGGYFSGERVPFGKIEACLHGLSPDTPLPAKTFRPAFIGKSNNNAGFLAAILRAEGLLTQDADKGYTHRIGCDWRAWQSALLACPGEPYTLPASLAVPATGTEQPGKGKRAAKRKSAPAIETPSDVPVGSHGDHHATA